jgi:hypothetical protein
MKSAMELVNTQKKILSDALSDVQYYKKEVKDSMEAEQKLKAIISGMENCPMKQKKSVS